MDASEFERDARPSVAQAGGELPSQANAMSEENVALRLAWEMRRRGWSQDRMAQEMTKAGCPTHQSAISKIVNPKPGVPRRSISVAEMIAMSAVFNVPLQELPLPREAAEGHELNETASRLIGDGLEIDEQLSEFLLDWRRLLHRLGNDEDRDAYIKYRAPRMPAEVIQGNVAAWRDLKLWKNVAAGYLVLRNAVAQLGAHDNPNSPVMEVGRSTRQLEALLQLLYLFETRLPNLHPKGAVHAIESRIADLLEAEILDDAIAVVDGYLRGEKEPTKHVVEAIERRLRKIALREAKTPLESLHSLAAKIGLVWKEGDSREDLAASLMVSVEDVNEAFRKIQIPRRGRPAEQ
ncbi:helix-turn-helix domain-containing protein [Nonomuraea sp. NPDC049646]|uniref:helix-turn-helix domain-containing protein n=1 Tax=unclassified Nonomuraea TaxID=2593643 RepID=UPI0037A37B59